MGGLGDYSAFGIQAEAMVTVQAMQIIEDGLIHEVAKCGAHGSTSNTTDKAAEQRTSYPAKYGASRACKGANSSADTSARCGGGYTRGDTSYGADRTADLAAMVGCLDLD